MTMNTYKKLEQAIENNIFLEKDLLSNVVETTLKKIIYDTIGLNSEVELITKTSDDKSLLDYDLICYGIWINEFDYALIKLIREDSKTYKIKSFLNINGWI